MRRYIGCDETTKPRKEAAADVDMGCSGELAFTLIISHCEPSINQQLWVTILHLTRHYSREMLSEWHKNYLHNKLREKKQLIFFFFFFSSAQREKKMLLWFIWRLMAFKR